MGGVYMDEQGLVYKRGSKWKKLTFKWRYKDEKEMQRVIERVLWQEGNKRVVEGLIYEHKTLYRKLENGKWVYEKEWKDSQQHLIGYHYFILQEKQERRWNDIEGFQGNIKNEKGYIYLIYNKHPIEGISYGITYEEGIRLFNKRNGFDFKPDLEEVKRIAKEVEIY